MPSLGEAPSGGAKTFWLLLGRLPKVTRCKSGTLSGRDCSNGYVLNPPDNQTTNPTPRLLRFGQQSLSCYTLYPTAHLR